ncbi:MAG: SusD/RagB family nutrient-binding outer membrane lipoprotein [Chitinophagaceae bacterium]
MKKLSIILLFGVSVAGCKKYLDVNEDPRTPQLTTAESLLPHMQASIGNAIGLDARYTSKYVQNFASVSALDISETHGSPFPNGAELWSNHYLRLGKSVDQMLFDATTNNKWHYAGAGKALRAWSWQTATDHFGEMILKEAWDDNKYIFNYDPQEEIYEEVRKNCNEALGYFGQKSPIKLSPTGDFMFYGNVDRWVKFVYGILARNANNIINKPSYDPAKVILYCDSSLSSNTDNATIEYISTITGNAHPFGALRSNFTTFVQSSVILNLLTGYLRNVNVIDPRINNMLVKSADGNYYGAVPTFGDPNSTVGNLKRIPNIQGGLGIAGNRYLFKDPIKWPIMTHSEILFIKAEAAFRSNKLNIAHDAYIAGISSNIDFVNIYGATQITPAQKATYLASASVAQSPANLKLSDIMSQKYIALWGWGFEQTWVDLRKYHYDTTVFRGYTIPDNTRLNIANRPDKLVYRFKTQNTEFLYNREALQALGAFNPDYHTYEMWFSKP